ncbi:MAG: O-antigen ligase family protein [Bacteroidia bacterium]|nr:O-antigen ligase family protein [Bacteroidia bacterium]
MNEEAIQNNSALDRFGGYAFYAGVLLTAFSMPLWNLGMSLGQFVMAGGWLLAGGLTPRLLRAFRQPVFWLLSALFFIHLAGLWNTEDMKYAMKDIRVKLPLLLMPLLIAAGPSLTLKQVRIVLYALMAGVLVSTAAGLIAWLGLAGPPVRDYRDLSLFISHIRLSLLLDFSLVAALWLSTLAENRKWKPVLYLYAAWSLFFLVLLQSLTGIALLFILLVAGALWRMFRPGGAGVRMAAALLVLGVGLAGTAVYKMIFIDSIREIQVEESELKTFTARGNPYKNNWSLKDAEQGRYIWMQYNDLEMDTAWQQRSRQSVWENDQQGHMQLVTLARYLTYKGFSKDAAGIAQLSEEDVQNIEAGYPTPEYVSGKYSILFRLRELANEYRNYYYNGYASGHSLAQRLEYWKTASWIIGQHRVAGVGTGDVPAAFQEAYNDRFSTLSQEWRLRAHNQYLSFAVAFGWPGLFLLLAVLIFCLRLAFQRRDVLYLSFLLIAAGSFFGEDTLETQAGVTFFAFLNGILLFGSPVPGENGRIVSQRSLPEEG